MPLSSRHDLQAVESVVCFVQPRKVFNMSDNDIDLQMKPKEPIPKFKSYEEEAEFWDTHDVTDYWDDFAPTHISFKGDLKEGVFVRLDSETLARIREAAIELDISPSALVATWILERLDAEKTKSPVSD